MAGLFRQLVQESLDLNVDGVAYEGFKPPLDSNLHEGLNRLQEGAEGSGHLANWPQSEFKSHELLDSEVCHLDECRTNPVGTKEKP